MNSRENLSRRRLGEGGRRKERERKWLTRAFKQKNKKEKQKTFFTEGNEVNEGDHCRSKALQPLQPFNLLFRSGV